MRPFIKKLKLRKAKQYDAEKVAMLFALAGNGMKKEEIDALILEKKVYVIKDKKKVKAAFSYTVWGVVGFFSLMYIQKLSVAPELRGQGVGSFLISRIQKESVKLGVTALFLYSVKKAEGFYRKNKLNSLWRFFWWRKT